MRHRVVFHNPVAILGGGEMGLLNVLRALGEDVEPHVVLPGAGPLADELTARGVPVTTVPMPPAVARLGRGGRSRLGLVLAAPWVLSYLHRTVAALRLLQPSLLWSNGVKSHLVCGVASRALGLPLVCHVRDVLGPVPFMGAVLGGVARRVVTPSAAAGAVLALPPGRLAVVPNAVDLQTFDRESGASVPTDALPAGDGPLVVAVGKLVPLKGFDLLLRALALVRDRVASVRLTVAGSEDYATQAGHGADLRAMAAELGLAASVVFAGERRPVAPLLAASAVVASASRSEGFGRAVLEGMAASRPVVATAVGGVPELVEDGVTGLLVPPESPGALAEALLRLLADPAEGGRLGLAGRRVVEERYTLGRLRQGLLGVLQEVLDGR